MLLNKKNLFLFFICVMYVTAQAQQRKLSEFDKIRHNFEIVPDTIQTSVYWYWISDNISKEGVIKDLQAMKKMGINRAFIGNIGLPAGDTPYGKVRIFSDEWWDILHAALKTAGDLNIQIGIFNSPGWSQSGGPWIKPEQSMRYLTSSRTLISGGKIVDVMLPKPTDQFQDVKVIAYPQLYTPQIANPAISAQPELSDLDKLLIVGNDKVVDFDKSGHQQIDFKFINEQAAQSLTVYPAKQAMFAKATLQANISGTFKTIKEFNIDRQNDALNVGFEPYAPIVISFAKVKAKSYRLLLDNYSPGSGILGLELSAAPRVERYPEKTLAKMYPTPLPYWKEYQWPAQPEVSGDYAIDPANVIDISAKMDTTGRLQWNAPDGNWAVMRTGMTSTLVKNAPATPAGTGLEVDKMSKKHVAYHFDNFLGEIIKRIPAQDRRTWKVVVEDSYETGGQNWTDNFINDFKAKYQYDPVAYLPVFKGWVVGSQEQSDRFLWDVRRLIADNVAYKYVAGLREVSHRHGLTTWLENYGHWGFPGEFLQYGGQSDEIGGEFWSEGDLGNIENRAASSAAHIYGKKKVSAESFTAGGKSYGRYPAVMKQRGDRFFAEGINNTLLHVFIEQPADDKLPGINAPFGNEFNRHNTWFYEMGGFIKYLKRINYLLQQGLYVADVAYFIGEDAPKMTGVQDPALPPGYSFDYINSEVILQRLKVSNGRFILPDGMSYKILVLPKLETMRPELLAKIAELVKQGGIVFGPKPLRSPSLAGYPEADNKVKSLAGDLWGTNVINKFVRAYGKGFVMNGPDLQAALNQVNTGPDIKISADSVAFLHRKLADADVYFMSNQSSKPISINPSFKITGPMPELWNAIDGTKRDLPQYTVKDGYTTVPLKLDVYESAFIVFNKKAGNRLAGQGNNFPFPVKIIPLAGPWEVSFDQAKRGPAKPVVFDALTSWTLSLNDSVRYYSGSSSYTKTFNLDAIEKGKKVYLNLGKVMVIASVKVNGVDAGSVWTAPYHINITKALRKGQNHIEIKVTNNWMNRLIGDSALPVGQRKTWTSYNPFNPLSALQTSGLLGPVTISIYDK
ncbi:glycosyl hydrolase [Mucilaginibacter litoreus]|uniref:Glycosyl hydrolase n=1 Tax=Mucilaginibacter litoreus TaxID=1048221 RepID=A0ABW3AWH8_9SPHI